MSPTRTCSACGHTSAGDDRFCPRCGTTLPGLTPAEHAEISQAPTVTVPSDPGLAAAAPVAPILSEEALESELRAALSPSFLLVRKLGEGGMASVYLAREPALRRLVAVKVLLPLLAVDPNARARFEREAQAVAALSHPNILAIYGLGELRDGTPYFVMQYVSGKSLAARLEEEGPFDVDEARRITGEVAAALAAAHAKGIVHRDIKPANILYDDESGRALVSDFGIAAVRAEPAEDGKTAARLTGTGMMVGTPQYMSPEQMLAEPVTEKTDVYALGLMGYELAAGQGPFKATTPQEMIAAHLRDTPRPLADVRKDVDPEFAGLVATCLEKDATKRPSAADVAKRLAPGGGVPLEWPPPGLDALHGALRRWSARLWLGNGLLVAIGALGFIAFGTKLPAANASIGAALLLLATVAGTLALIVAVVGIVRAFRAATRAVDRGYGWASVLETMADARRDTGALLAGVREYATLEPRVRSGLRTARVRRDLLVLLSGVLPLPMLVVLSWLAGLLPAVSAPVVLLGPSLLALGAAIGLERREERAVRSARRALARRRLREDYGKLVEPWYVSFESVREGQALGRGSRQGARLSWAAALVAAFATVAVLTVLLPLWLVGAGGPLYLQDSPTASTGMMRKLAISERMRPYMLPADSSLGARLGGEAYYALTSPLTFTDSASEPAAGWNPAEWLPVPHRLPPLPELRPAEQGLFLQSLSKAWKGPHETAVIPLARAGFSPAQRRWLATLVAHPAWRDLATFARAPRMDFVAARYRLPFTEPYDPGALPIPRFPKLRTLAYANGARIAYYLDRREYDSAETAARELISAGLQVIDHGTFLIEMLYGAVLTGIGRDQLRQFYAATGDPRSAALEALRDSIANQLGAFAAPSDTTGASEAPAPVDRARWLALFSDTTYPVALRLEVAMNAGAVRCTNVRELLFGPSKDVDSAFAAARSRTARNAGDSALIDMVQRAAHRGPDTFGYAVLGHYSMNPDFRAARTVIQMVMHNSPLPACAVAAAGMIDTRLNPQAGR